MYGVVLLPLQRSEIHPESYSIMWGPVRPTLWKIIGVDFRAVQGQIPRFLTQMVVSGGACYWGSLSWLLQSSTTRGGVLLLLVSVIQPKRRSTGLFDDASFDALQVSG